MPSLPASERPEALLFSDGLGERVVAADGATPDLLQILRLRPALTAVPSFEFALRERAARLANFRHAYFARVRRVDRVMSPTPSLAIVSDHIEGIRLSEILRLAHEMHLQLDLNASMCLIRQLVPTVAVLHENARDVAHGLIAPERLIVTPNARLVLTEHVLGAAIEQLQYGRDRLWQELRVAMPPSAGLPRFDHRADVTGLGLVALALVLGRPIAADEYPHKTQALLNDARERSALGEEQPLSAGLRGWLARALQLDVRRAFASAPEAAAALEELVAEDSIYVAAPVALENFMTRYVTALLDASPEPVEVPAPAPSAEFSHGPVAVSMPEFAHAPVVPQAVPAAVSPAPVPEADPVARVAAAVDIRELIDVDQLPELDRPAAEHKPLFDPDAPFMVQPLEPAQVPARARSRVSLRVAAMVAGVVLLGGGGVFALKLYGNAGAPRTGTLVVESRPPGVPVFIDGVAHGVTPQRLSVKAGSHLLELRGRGTPRVIPLTVAAGAELSQYLELADSPATGELAVQSDPPGAKVLVDGIERGVAPLTVADLTPGDHEVVLRSDTGAARHTVTVQAGGTASLVVPMAAASNGPVFGWVTVKAPFTVEIREGGRLLGSTDADRVMMSAGRHDLELVNEALGYRSKRVVQVPPGKVASLVLDLPRGVVNLNAAPWAEVWLDGQRVGETPIGNLAVAIGPHEFVFKHPQLGEKRQAVSVTLGAPVRLSVDMK